MKKTEVAELRALSVEELQQKIEESRRFLLNQRFAQVVEGARRGPQVANTRRNIARMLTLIAEKKAEA